MLLHDLALRWILKGLSWPQQASTRAILVSKWEVAENALFCGRKKPIIAHLRPKGPRGGPNMSLILQLRWHQDGPTWSNMGHESAMSLKSVRMGHLGLKVGSVGKPVFYNVFWWFWGSIWPQHVSRLAQHGPTAVCRPPAPPYFTVCCGFWAQKMLCFTAVFYNMFGSFYPNMAPRWELGHNMAQPGPNMARTWPQHGRNMASTAPSWPNITSLLPGQWPAVRRKPLNNLPIYLSICLSIYLSIYQSIYLPIYLSTYLPIYLSINLI